MQDKILAICVKFIIAIIIGVITYAVCQLLHCEKFTTGFFCGAMMTLIEKQKK